MTAPKPTLDDDDDDDDEGEADETSSASLVGAFEGPLAMLLATGTDPNMREQVMVGLGRSLLDEKTALKYLPALVNASVTALEQPPVRAAAFQAVVDLALLFDSAAPHCATPSTSKACRELQLSVKRTRRRCSRAVISSWA